jgi:hypothetical protein
MQNLGNSCYMASVMQTLFMVPEFQARFYKQRDALLQQLVRFCCLDANFVDDSGDGVERQSAWNEAQACRLTTPQLIAMLSVDMPTYNVLHIMGVGTMSRLGNGRGYLCCIAAGGPRQRLPCPDGEACARAVVRRVFAAAHQPRRQRRHDKYDALLLLLPRGILFTV